MCNPDCKRFEECSAPLCPMDKVSLEHGIFFSDEEICRLKEFQSLRWVKRQKAIVRKGISNEGYFSILMLNSRRQIRKGTEGINPDQSLEKALVAERVWAGENEPLTTRGRKIKSPQLRVGKYPNGKTGI